MLLKPVKISNHLTWLSLLGLILGILFGVYHADIQQYPVLGDISNATEVTGIIWVNILQVVALPLILFLIWLALSKENLSRLGRLGVGCLFLFLAFHVLGGIFVLSVSPAIIYFVPHPDPGNLEIIQDQISLDEGAAVTMSSNLSRIIRFLFSNHAVIWLKNNLWVWILIPVVVNLFSHLFYKKDLVPTKYIRSVLNFIFRIIVLLIYLVPIGMMGLVITISKAIGWSIAEILLYFSLTICLVLIFYNLLLVIITKYAGNYQWKDLINALKAPYLVAFSTRSSLAAMPVMAEESEKYLSLSPQIIGFSFPVTVAFFRANRMVSSTFHLLFLNHILQLHIGSGTILVFMFFVLLISVLSQAIPGGGYSYEGLPVFVDAGVPAESYLMLKTVDAIPDIFSTIINTTSFLTIATFLQRFVKNSDP